MKLALLIFAALLTGCLIQEERDPDAYWGFVASLSREPTAEETRMLQNEVRALNGGVGFPAPGALLVSGLLPGTCATFRDDVARQPYVASVDECVHDPSWPP